AHRANDGRALRHAPLQSAAPRRPRMKIIRLLFWAAIFLALLLFSLHNQQDTAVYFFFGTVWHAPLVLVVLAAFATGLAIGALGMVPRWLRHRAAARRAQEHAAAAGAATMPPPNTGHHGL